MRFCRFFFLVLLGCLDLARIPVIAEETVAEAVIGADGTVETVPETDATPPVADEEPVAETEPVDVAEATETVEVEDAAVTEEDSAEMLSEDEKEESEAPEEESEVPVPKVEEEAEAEPVVEERNVLEDEEEPSGESQTAEVAAESEDSEPVKEAEIPVERIATQEGVGDPHCPNRSHIIKCTGQYLDKDQDAKLSRKELDDAIESLPWYARGILKILGSTDSMMDKCDVDKDGYISMDFDMINNADKCLATCFKRRSFKASFFPDCDL